MNQNKLETVLIGTDPEVFVVNRQTRQVLSAIGLIPGTKDRPFDISDTGHAIQTDNVMAEFCVPPSNNPSKLYADIRQCIDFINGLLPAHAECNVQASAFLDPLFLRNRQAKTFGCDPDFNVYSLSQNDAPKSNTNLRTAGGHIHIGYENPDQKTNMKIIQAMDLFLGIPSILLDKDTERRKMYGKAGCFREKSYGVEYRTLSNFWIASEELVNWAFTQSMRAVKFAFEEDWLVDEVQVDIQLAINKQDLDLACKIAKQFNITMSQEQYITV